MFVALSLFVFFFFNDTATTEIYTLSLHDALPISEMAAAITVWSPLENPASAARSRPRCRAVTTSTSAVMGMSKSSATVEASRSAIDAELGLDVEERQTFFQVEGGRHALERQPELHHRERDL